MKPSGSRWGRPFHLIPLLALWGVGCAPSDGVDGETGPPKVAFEGKVEPALAGTWETADKSSVLELGKDGALNLSSTFPTPQGKQTSTKRGRWLVGDGKMRLQYPAADGSPETIAYAMNRNGDRMTLSTKVPKLETDYVRRAAKPTN
jgi:hypothetical protein